MKTFYDFAADGVRAKRLNVRMHRELGVSLAYLSQAARPMIPGAADALSGLLGRLNEASTNVAPGVFARYYALVEALESSDFSSAQQLILQLGAADAAAPGLEILALDDPALGEDASLYQGLMNAGVEVDLGFLPPSDAVVADFRLRLGAGLDLLDEALPDLSAEIRAIIRQVVIAGSDPTKKLQFDGGSHFRLWGAVFLNGHYHPDRIAVAEVLAHESAHSLLFGFCTDEALVENEDDELFSSPLRPDPRPMDGIYHATFVSARMHWAMSALSTSSALTSLEQLKARNAAATDRRNFTAGFDIVAANGRLTQTGQQLMAAAKAYMDASD